MKRIADKKEPRQSETGPWTRLFCKPHCLIFTAMLRPLQHFLFLFIY
jgi:hypothetical protein